MNCSIKTGYGVYRVDASGRHLISMCAPDCKATAEAQASKQNERAAAEGNTGEYYAVRWTIGESRS